METEWPAKEYEIGSYVQATVAEPFLSRLKLKETDQVLDVGCGNGAFTRKILDRVPKGRVLGIDPSENMLNLARNVAAEYPNFSVKKDNVSTMSFKEEFDHVVSFWYLQWAPDIREAFINMFKALKKGGGIFALIPTGDDPYIFSYYALRDSGKFPCLKNFKAPVDYSRLENIEEKIGSIPHTKVTITSNPVSLKLPNLDFYRKFVNGIAFYQNQVEARDIKLLNEAMVEWYNNHCLEKYNGEFQFNLSVYIVIGEKC